MLKKGKYTEKNFVGKGVKMSKKNWLKRGEINWEMKIEKEGIFLKEKVGTIFHQTWKVRRVYPWCNTQFTPTLFLEAAIKGSWKVEEKK